MKTRTQKLVAKNYLNAGRTELAIGGLGRLVDDAVEALDGIRYNGYGEGNQRRSRRVISRSFREVLIKAGYTERQANDLWLNQVRALADLNANAEN